MNSQVTNKKTILINKPFLLLFLFFITRLSLNTFGINSDQKWISLMQHIDLNYLNVNLFESIIYFHSQPPFWNLIIGIGVKIFGPDPELISNYLYFINILCSIGIIFYSIKILQLLNISKNKIFYLIFIFIICSPSIIFYEYFLSYAHFTCFNIFLLKYYLLKFYIHDRTKDEIKIYIFASILMLTWSAYTILFLFIILFLIKIKKGFNIKSLLIFFLFICIANLPSIKNKILFNFFTSSSWTGINASQSLGYDREEWSKCSFDLRNVDEYNYIFKQKNGNKKIFDKPILNDGKFNDVGFLERSKYCSKKIIGHVKKNYKQLFFQKFNRFLSIHGHLSIDYLFKPKGWNEKMFILEYLNLNEFFKILVFIFFFTIYLFFFILFYKSTFNKNKNYLDYFIIANFLLYSYLMTISILGSSWEQERMRYTEYSFILIAITLFTKKIKLI